MIFKRKQDKCIYSPLDGSYVPLKEVSDSTFAQELIGPGFAVYPSKNTISSPVEGEITMIFPTLHAIGLRRNDGLEILIHIGIETINLNGKGFKVYKQLHTKVKKGENLIYFDKELIKGEGLDPTVIVVFTNHNEYDISFKSLSGIIKKGDEIAYAK